MCFEVLFVSLFIPTRSRRPPSINPMSLQPRENKNALKCILIAKSEEKYVNYCYTSTMSRSVLWQWDNIYALVDCFDIYLPLSRSTRSIAICYIVIDFVDRALGSSGERGWAENEHEYTRDDTILIKTASIRKYNGRIVITRSCSTVIILVRAPASGLPRVSFNIKGCTWCSYFMTFFRVRD